MEPPDPKPAQRRQAAALLDEEDVAARSLERAWNRGGSYEGDSGHYSPVVTSPSQEPEQRSPMRTPREQKIRPQLEKEQPSGPPELEPLSIEQQLEAARRKMQAVYQEMDRGPVAYRRPK